MKPLFFRKAVVLLLAVAILSPFAPVAVPRAHAVGIINFTIGDAQRILTEVLERAAIIAAQQVIQSVTRSIVNWIQSGFDGSPAFATNLGVNMRQLADGVALDFLDQLESNTSISSPFLSRAVRATRAGYLLYNSRDAVAARLSYTLDRYSRDPNAFLRGNFSQGGFNAWFAMTRQCGNDPYCAQFVTEEEVARRTNTALENWLHEYDAGQGFLSYRCHCQDSADNGWGANLSDADHSASCQICTPGSTIAGQMEFLANQPQLQLTVATSLDQILGALASQLISSVIGSDGLLGGGGGGGSGRSGSSLPTGVGASLSANFTEVAQNERRNTVSYQTAWQTLQEAATRASQACALGLGSAASRETATSAKAQADAALAKASRALAALDSIITRAGQAQSLTGTSQSALVQQVTTDYQCLLRGDTPSESICQPATGSTIGTTCPVTPGTLPTGSEMACATTESQDTPGTFLTRLNAIAQSGCN